MSTHEGAFVVIAEFAVKPERLEDFLACARADSEGATGTEPGCRQFDVTVPEDGAPVVVLYEVYDDRAAFDAHLETPHLRAFRDAIEPMVVSRDVRFLTRVFP